MLFHSSVRPLSVCGGRNAAAEQLFGYTAEEALGVHCIELLCMESTYEAAGQILDGLHSGQSWTGQFPIRKKSGEVFTAMITSTPMYSVDGTLSSVISVANDARPFKDQLESMLTSSRASSGSFSEGPSDADGPPSREMPRISEWSIPFVSTLSSLVSAFSYHQLNIRGCRLRCDFLDLKNFSSPPRRP